jgi:hypothetical protein
MGEQCRPFAKVRPQLPQYLPGKSSATSYAVVGSLPRPSLRIMIAQAKMAANDLRATAVREPLPEEMAKAGNPKGAYVHPDRLKEIHNIKHKDFDLTKLLQLLKELDLSFRTGCYLAAAMLVRAVLDHVPPILGVSTFAAVANNYAGTRSFRESMLNLENSSRRIADQHLHGQIRSRETLPTARQVDFSPDMDVLLAEIIRVLKQP